MAHKWGDWNPGDKIYTKDLQAIEDKIAKLPTAEEVKKFEVLENKLYLKNYSFSKFFKSFNITFPGTAFDVYLNSGSVKSTIDCIKSPMYIDDFYIYEPLYEKDFYNGDKLEIKEISCYYDFQKPTIAENGSIVKSETYGRSFGENYFISKLTQTNSSGQEVTVTTAQLKNHTSLSEQQEFNVYLVNPFSGEEIKASNTLNITIKHQPPTRLEIQSEPTTKIYADGANIKLDGIVAIAYDKNGNLYNTTETPNGVVPASLLSCSPVKASKDDTTITVSFMGVTATFNIDIAEIDHIKITKEPDKKVYNTGDNIDLTGIEVKMYDQYGNIYMPPEMESGEVPSSYLTCSVTEIKMSREALANYDRSEVQTISISYGSFSDTYEITVNLIMPTILEVTSSKMSYYSEETIDKSVCTFTLYCINNGIRTLWNYSPYLYPNGVVSRSEINFSVEAAISTTIDTTQTIGVSWNNHYNNVVLNSSFTISVIGVTDPAYLDFTIDDDYKIQSGREINKYYITVQAYKADGTPWTDKDHQNSSGTLKPEDFDFIDNNNNVITYLENSNTTPYKSFSNVLGVKFLSTIKKKNIMVYNTTSSFYEISNEDFKKVIDSLRAGDLTIDEVPWREGEYKKVDITINNKKYYVEMFINKIVNNGTYLYSLGFNTATGTTGTPPDVVYGNTKNSYNWKKNTGTDACTLRAYCNTTFRNGLPEEIRKSLLQYEHIVSINSNETTTVTDYLSPPWDFTGMTNVAKSYLNGYYWTTQIVSNDITIKRFIASPIFNENGYGIKRQEYEYYGSNYANEDAPVLLFGYV